MRNLRRILQLSLTGLLSLAATERLAVDQACAQAWLAETGDSSVSIDMSVLGGGTYTSAPTLAPAPGMPPQTSDVLSRFSVVPQALSEGRLLVPGAHPPTSKLYVEPAPVKTVARAEKRKPPEKRPTTKIAKKAPPPPPAAKPEKIPAPPTGTAATSSVPVPPPPTKATRPATKAAKRSVAAATPSGKSEAPPPPPPPTTHAAPPPAPAKEATPEPAKPTPPAAEVVAAAPTGTAEPTPLTKPGPPPAVKTEPPAEPMKAPVPAMTPPQISTPTTAPPEAPKSVAAVPKAAPPAAQPSTPPAEALLVPGQVALQVVFPEDVSKLPNQVKPKLKQLAAQLEMQPNLRLQLLAYAGGTSMPSSKARRLSLSRALSVRSYLIENGIRSTRIDVRALGNKTTEEPLHRVDLNVAER